MIRAIATTPLDVAQLPFIYKWVAAMPDVHSGIAARAGVTQGLLNYHFSSKDELWRAAVDGLYAELFSLQAAAYLDSARQAIVVQDLASGAVTLTHWSR